MVIDGAAILIRRVVIFAQKLGELSQNRDTTHPMKKDPMKKDVKEKSFSPPL
jgi:hypothetical protein